jgi:hypothetical protein
MTRFSGGTNQTWADRPHCPYVLLVEFDFASGFVRLNSGVRTYQHNSNNFFALGTFGSIGNVRENGNLSPEKLEFQLSGVNNSLVGVTLTEDYHNRPVSLWVGYVHETSLEIITTPHLICENQLIRWNDAADWTYTHEHQRLFDATDNFFDQVAVLTHKIVKWGGTIVARFPGIPGRDERNRDTRPT